MKRIKTIHHKLALFVTSLFLSVLATGCMDVLAPAKSNSKNKTSTDQNSITTLSFTDSDHNISFQTGQVQSVEQAGTSLVFLVLNQPRSDKEILVEVVATDGMATSFGSDRDYMNFGVKTVRFAPGVVRMPVEVSLINDSIREPNENFSLRITRVINGVIGQVNQSTVTIIDDDMASPGGGNNPVASFLAPGQSVQESAPSALAIILLDKPVNMATAINYSLSRGSAQLGSDFSGIQPQGQITIPSGQTVGTINISLIDDNLSEPDENFTITLMGNPQVSVGATSSHTITIIDNDPDLPPPSALSVAFATPSSNASESMPQVPIAVQLSQMATSAVVLSLSVVGGSASVNSDFILAQSTIMIAPGSSSGQFQLSIIDDATVEASESIMLRLSSLSPGISIGANATHMVTITDNDNTPPPSENVIASFAQAMGQVNEAMGIYSATVNLSRASATPVILSIMASGQAQANSDYVLGISTLVIPPGMISMPISLMIINDTVVDPNENIVLTLGTLPGSQGVVLGTPSSHLVTIQDDDQNGPGPNASLANFQATIYSQFLRLERPQGQVSCMACHDRQSSLVSGGRSPVHSDADPAHAFSIVNAAQLINKNSPELSRFVTKIKSGHNCPTGDCDADADAVLVQIRAFLALEAGNSGGSNNGQIQSPGQTLAQGRLVQPEGRYGGANLMALWDFTEGQGNVVGDRSGNGMNLSIVADRMGSWVGEPGNGQAYECMAQGNMMAGGTILLASLEQSRRIYDQVAGPNGSKAFTFEVWTAAANGAQNGPARIMTYSLNALDRNTTFGQENNYAVNRLKYNNVTGNNGINNGGIVRTADDTLDGALTQWVMTFDGNADGRKIYRNGELVVDRDGLFKNNNGDDIQNRRGIDMQWFDNHLFALCNETNNDTDPRPWRGEIYLAGIWNKALSVEEVNQNFDAGVLPKVVLNLSLASHLGPGASLEMSVQTLGDNGYSFTNPKLTGLNAPVKVMGMEVLINGQKGNGQSYKYVNGMFGNNEPFKVGNANPVGMSALAQNGKDEDQISVKFMQLGSKSNVETESQLPFEGDNTSVSNVEPAAPLGLAHRIELYRGISSTLSIPFDNERLREEFEKQRDNLPTGTSISPIGYTSSFQMALYNFVNVACEEAVKSTTWLEQTFAGINFGQNRSLNDNEREVAISTLHRLFVGESQASISTDELRPILNSLFDQMEQNGQRNRIQLHGACTAIAASPVTLVR